MRAGVGCDVQTGRADCGGRGGCSAQNIRIWSEKEEKVVAPRLGKVRNAA